MAFRAGSGNDFQTRNRIAQIREIQTKPLLKFGIGGVTRDLIHALEAFKSIVETFILSSRKKPNKAKVTTKNPQNR